MHPVLKLKHPSRPCYMLWFNVPWHNNWQLLDKAKDDLTALLTPPE